MTRRSLAVIAVTLPALAACPHPKPKPDAPPADVLFTGEYVDWDSSDANFCGIFQATFQDHDDATRVDHTNPNGRFMLMVPGAGKTQIDITPPTGSSPCLVPTSTYTMPGIAIADPAVIAAVAATTGATISTRDFTVARRATLGATLDPAKGHVFVHVNGTQSAVTISTTSDAAQRFDGTSWAAGTSGIDVFFPNVPAGTTTVMMGPAIGNGDVPVVAGTITYTTLVFAH